MASKSRVVKLISLILVLALVIQVTACSSVSATSSRIKSSELTEETLTENILTEDSLDEDVLYEFITEEIYLEEIVLAEEKITEILLEEDTIEEVNLCVSIYVPEDKIEEFAEHSQTSRIFGEDIDLSSVLTKVAVGTGVIVTVVILSKVGLQGQIGSIVAAAAPKTMQFAATGAVMGSLYGGLTGASDEIDESGRTTAIVGFACATAGLILSIVSLIATIPSGGTSAITLGVGVKLAIAGISVLLATAGTVSAGYDAVQTLQTTDSADIDWDNIDWDDVGVSAAEQAIENTADGYMWGAIVGAVVGGAEGYDFYNQYGTPYSEYNARLQRTPVNGGHWEGERGESAFILDEPIELPDGTVITQVNYHNAVPDFSPYARANVSISNMTNSRSSNFSQADRALASYWDRIQYEGRSWNARAVANYRSENGLTWHELNNMHEMQLVPSEVNATFTHLGGVGEYNAMIGQEPDYIPDSGDVAVYNAVVDGEEADDD